jgi:uncharacterized protein
MNQPRYRTLSSYLKNKFGQSVRKLSLDAGFTCPNRDSTFSDAGCIYCEPESFSIYSNPSAPPLIQQIRQGIESGHRRGVHRFIAYFQAYTNTHGPVGKLKDIYDTIHAFPEIVGLAIGTRPDCVDREKLKLIASYTKDYDVWLDYGVQSIHEETLNRINRGHGPEAIFRAVLLTREHPEIKICAHIILGLPGEDAEMELVTAKAMAKLKIEGIKFHPLHVIKGTRLAKEYDQNRYEPLTMETYVERLVRFLEVTWSETVIQRLSADSMGDTLIAPTWLREKSSVIQAIQKKMEQEDTWQGKLFKEEVLV